MLGAEVEGFFSCGAAGAEEGGAVEWVSYGRDAGGGRSRGLWWEVVEGAEVVGVDLDAEFGWEVEETGSGLGGCHVYGGGGDGDDGVCDGVG